MPFSTKISTIEKLYDLFGINKKFHKFKEDWINQDNSFIVSPVEATLVASGKIKDNGEIVSKFNKKIILKELIGKYSKSFISGFYLNFYLNPGDRHYWRLPYPGKFIFTRINNGKGKIPVPIGLEKILKKDFFSKVIIKNASISSILQTKKFPIAMIAVGSLNVNGIKILYEDNKNYEKGEICGYFKLGSSMLLCFPKGAFEQLIKVEEKVNIGQPIVRIKI